MIMFNQFDHDSGKAHSTLPILTESSQKFAPISFALAYQSGIFAADGAAILRSWLRILHGQDLVALALPLNLVGYNFFVTPVQI